MAIEQLIHNGKKVLYIDYTNCKTQDEMIALMEKAVAIYKSSPEKVRMLSNFEGAFIGMDFMNRLKNYAKTLNNKTEKAAIIGIDGLKEILLKGFNMVAKNPTKPFNTKIEALNWLTR